MHPTVSLSTNIPNQQQSTKYHKNKTNHRSYFVLVKYFWAWGLPWRAFAISSFTPLERMILLAVSNRRGLCPHFPFCVLRRLSRLSLCIFYAWRQSLGICVWISPDLPGTCCFVESSITSGSALFLPPLLNIFLHLEGRVWWIKTPI